MDNHKLVESLLKHCDKNDIAESLARELDRVDQTKRDVSTIKKAMKAEEDRFDKAMKELCNGLQVIRKACRHPVLQYHSDVSGGEDSYYECQICGFQDDDSPYAGYDG